MTLAKKPIKITEVVLRDAHQSLLATRMTMDEMRPILPEMDKSRRTSPLSAGAALPSTPASAFWTRTPGRVCASCARRCPTPKLQMLFRGQNMLGYRHLRRRRCGVLRPEVRCQRHRRHPYFRRPERHRATWRLPSRPPTRKALTFRPASATPLSPGSINNEYFAQVCQDAWRRWAPTPSASRIWLALLKPYKPAMTWSLKLKNTVKIPDQTSTATTPPVWLPCPS